MRGARPKHIGFIPDGNRRWAVNRGLRKEQGYTHGIAPGIQLLKLCAETGISEISIFGFTKDNVRRSASQRRAFSLACVEFARAAIAAGAALKIVGDTKSKVFPPELRDLPRSRGKGKGKGLRVNLLVNYDWRWDLDGLKQGAIRSAAVPKIDLVVRWGGRCRLSGFLPVQSVYADFFSIAEYWPDFEPEHLQRALAWFKGQDRTLGG